VNNEYNPLMLACRKYKLDTLEMSKNCGQSTQLMSKSTVSWQRNYAAKGGKRRGE